MKRKFIIGLLCMFTFMGSTRALETKELQAKLDSVAPNGVMEIKSIKPTNEGEELFYKDKVLKDLETSEYYYELVDCNEDLTTCDLGIQMKDGSNGLGISVTLKWSEENPDAKEAIEKAKTEFLNKNQRYFELEDLEIIDYLYHHNINDLVVDFDKYSKEFRSMVTDPKISLHVSLQAGVKNPLDEGGMGAIIFSYDDVVYGYLEATTNNQEYFGIGAKNVFYIPDETENTSEAFIAAAKKRIDELLGENDIKIIAKPIANLETDLEYTDFAITDFIDDATKAGDYYYVMTIKGEEKAFIIAKDSSKMQKLEDEKTEVEEKVTVQDKTLNISVSSTSKEVPKDTVLQVKVIENTTNEFKEIVNVLKVKVAQVLDLKLYSASENKNITKINDGEFEVSVPIQEDLKGKELAAYYIADDGKIEVYPVEVKDDMAIFKTTHFSIYTLAEKKDIKEVVSPDTADGFMKYVAISTIGIVGIAATMIYMKKREN